MKQVGNHHRHDGGQANDRGNAQNSDYPKDDYQRQQRHSVFPVQLGQRQRAHWASYRDPLGILSYLVSRVE